MEVTIIKRNEEYNINVKAFSFPRYIDKVSLLFIKSSSISQILLANIIFATLTISDKQMHPRKL